MSVIANPEVTTIRAEDLKALPAWRALKAAVIGLQQVQVQEGSVPEPADHDQARQNVGIITDSINDLRHRSGWKTTNESRKSGTTKPSDSHRWKSCTSSSR